MKKTVSMILCAIMLICSLVVPASAAQGDINIPQNNNLTVYDLDANAKDSQGVLYTLDADKGEAVVGLNTYSDSNSAGYTGNGTVIIPDQVKKDGKTYNVVAVGRNAFDTSAVKEVIISNTVKTIGEMAFAGCEQLERVAMGTGVTEIRGLAFWHCTRLVDASIGQNVTTIGGAAFWSCVSLETVTIPTSVTTVMQKAFWNCSNLKVAEMNNHCPEIGADAFTGCAADFAIGCDNDSTALFANAGYTVKATGGFKFVAAKSTVYAEKGETVTLRVLSQGNNHDTTVEGWIPAKYNGTVGFKEITVNGNTTETIVVEGISFAINVVVCDHATTEEIVTVCATCGNAGEKATVCTTCYKVVKTEAVAQLEHSWQDIITEPTCIDAGYTTHKCSLCREKNTDTEVEALGHAYVSEITAKSTMSFNGTMKHTCDRCKRVETETLPFLADVNNDGSINVTDAVTYLRREAKWDVEFHEVIADVNADGKVNISDAVHLLRYLANWDVEIG